MSTLVLALHRVTEEACRPHLVLERHGSPPVEHIRAVLHEFGFVTLGPQARTRLQQRD